MKPSTKRWMPQTAGARAMAILVIGYVLLFFWLACRKFDACNTQQGDLALWDSMYYMTLRGKFFWCFHLDNSYFESHSEPLLVLFVPLYAVAQSVKTLFLLQTVCIAVASIPMFLLGRKVLGHEAAGVLMAVAFLFFAPLVSQNVNQVHTSVFPLPFLMFAFLFFQEEKFVPFLVMLVLASLGKEMSTISAFAFAPYALWGRRRWKWILASLLIPAAGLSLCLGIIRPYFARGESYLQLQYFPGFGKSLGEFAATILTSPAKVASALFTSENGLYVFLLLTGVAYVLPFLAPEVVFTLPELFFNTLSSNNGMKVVGWHYNTNAGVFLMVAALYGLARVNRFCQRRLGAGDYGPVLAGCVAVLCLSTWWQWFSPGEYQLNAAHEARQRAFRLVPRDDSLVAGPGQIRAHLAQREVLVMPPMIKVKPEYMFDYNWVFFDMNWQTPIEDLYVPKEMLMAYANNPDYELIFAESNIFVLHRKTPIPPEKARRIRFTG